MLKLIACLVLIVSYVGLALGSFPGLRMNRPAIALVGSAILIALGITPLKEAWQAIDATTIVFLLSMMIVNASLAYSGLFQIVLVNIVKITHSPLGLLVMLTFGSGILSAFLLNDTLALVFTPLTVKVCQALSLSPIPYLLTLAAATNIGSLATISGNPQNILIGSFSGIAYLEFAKVMTPIALMGMLMQIGLLYGMYPEVRSVQPFKQVPMLKPQTFTPLLSKSLVITGCLFTAFIVGLPLAESAFLAASALLITRRLRSERFFSQIDWGLLLLFSGLFILTRATRNLDLLSPLTQLVDLPIGLIASVTILSNLISNVPAVLLLQPLIAPENSQSWLLLAAGSTLAGNLTLFGAVANLITVEAASKAGYQLNFLIHLRFGLPLTLITLTMSYLWIRSV
ncbi:MAG: anion transporter [Cyanobacteria bacterium M5B4]|nr:MAG: anion transporter [Cyanobacteria bacterium M5B4]